MVTLNTGELIYVPKKPDLSTRVYGDTFTADDLHYMRLRDAKARFIVETMVDDEFRNGFVYKNDDHDPLETLAHERIIRKAMKYKRAFGWSLVVHLDGVSESLDVDILDESIEIQAWHPYVNDIGGITNWDTDDATGLPTYFYIKPYGSFKTEIKVAASRCHVLTNGDQTNQWQGYTSIGSNFDELLAMRLWSAVAMRRVRDYATIRYLIMRLGQPGPIDAAELARIANAMGDIPHAAVSGEYKVEQVGGPVDDTEMQLATSNALQSIAVGAGINTADMTGSEAGAKLSTDSNMNTYDNQIRDMQLDDLPTVRAIMKRLGHEVVQFKPSWQFAPKQKYDLLSKLCDSYTTAAQELKEPLAMVLKEIFLSEFGRKIEIEVQEPEPMLMQNGNKPGAAPGGFQQTSRGTFRPAGNPAGSNT